MLVAPGTLNRDLQFEQIYKINLCYFTKYIHFISCAFGNWLKKASFQFKLSTICESHITFCLVFILNNLTFNLFSSAFSHSHLWSTQTCDKQLKYFHKNHKPIFFIILFFRQSFNHSLLMLALYHRTNILIGFFI